MTAELWLVKPCKHGHLEAHEGWPSDAKVWGDYIDCEGGSSVRLDPDKVVSFLEPGYGPLVLLSVQDIIDALEEE